VAYALHSIRSALGSRSDGADLTGCRPVRQQPDWPDDAELRAVTGELAARPPLVDGRDVRTLRTLLARVAAGEAHVVQAGDCAEDPAECGAGDISRKAGLLDVLAGVMRMATHRPVVRIGRIAGQYAKPRSQPTETLHDGTELPAYRGHLVNSHEPDPVLRIPDPRRLLAGYDAAHEATGNLGWLDRSNRSESCPPVWTSHEALLLAYEIPLVRRDTGGLLLASTHFPWIGERTGQADGAHVELLSRVVNPVACKVGPNTTAEELLRRCERLDPHHEPGRLTLIARMGADKVRDRLPALVRAVLTAGHPVVWLTDPMHGNTVTTPDRLKTRLVTTVIDEVEGFLEAVAAAGGTAGGIHLETTPDMVTECADDHTAIGGTADKYTSLCDPRLNPKQVIAVMSAWRDTTHDPFRKGPGC
jgi:3-deoxy-7-phosphoheptulonate synthase